MRVPRIYTEQDLDSALQSEDTLCLSGDAAHHILKALRMSAGRTVILFNGSGSDYKAIIESADKRSAHINVRDKIILENESPLHCHLAIGISRGDRFDFVLQKATELGAQEITPLLTERTEVKLSKERLIKKMASWRKIIVGACEQSGRSKIPTLNPPIAFHSFTKAPRAGLKLVLHHRCAETLSTMGTPKIVTLLVGPEGGLSEEEIKNSEGKEYQPLNLGPRVLRTETAPITALSVLQYQWGDIS